MLTVVYHVVAGERMRGWFGRTAVLASMAASLMIVSAPAKADSRVLITGGLGAFDFLHNYTAGEGRLELRFAQSFFYLKPSVGTFFTTKGSVYTYFALRGEIPLGSHFMIIPIAAVGDYEKGKGKDLGAHIEFKTGGEFDYVFSDGLRIGPAFDHVSNAGIGKKNPGEENLLMMVTVPLGLFVGAGN
jgi:lipid A 3-O-deacylase